MQRFQSAIAAILLAALPKVGSAQACPTDRIYADGFDDHAVPFGPIHLMFATQPSTTPVGVVMSPAIKVSVQDACNTPVSSVAVHASIGQNPTGHGAMTGTQDEYSDASGVAVFGDLSIDWFGSGYTLLATLSGSSGVGAESAQFNETRVGDPCLGPDSPACQQGVAACADSDGDGLNDAWETAGGVDVNGDGKITDSAHDLLLPGADPTKADIYLEYDWMDYGQDEATCVMDSDCTSLGRYHDGEVCGQSGGLAGQCYYACTADADCTSRWPSEVHVGERCMANTCEHTHDPAAQQMNFAPLIAAFAAHGIALHLVAGHAVPHSHVVSYRSDDQMTANCEGGTTSAGNVGIGKYAVSFYDLKPQFPSLSAFHYALFSHYSGCDTKSHCPASPANTSDCASTTLAFGESGLAELSGNDIIVSLGGLVNDSGLAPGAFVGAATLMHELGHNLGLHHDGHIDSPCPNGTGCQAGDTCSDLHDGQGLVCHETVNGLLGHEEPNYKPNYLSLMNYRYQKSGISYSSALGSRQSVACNADSDCGGANAVCLKFNTTNHCSVSDHECATTADCPNASDTCIAAAPPLGQCATTGYACAADADCYNGDNCVAPSGAGTCSRMDYSRQVLPVAGLAPGLLDEANLSDTPGLGSGNTDLFTYTDALCHTCPLTAPTDGAVDWTGNGLYTTPLCNVVQFAPESYGDSGVVADIDAAFGCSGSPSDVLHGHADWPDVSGIAFNYAFQCTPSGNTNVATIPWRRIWVP
jgi:hypothetical protein